MDIAAAMINRRTSSYPIDPLFLQRWSPRAFTGEAMGDTELCTLLEAARWAPSSYNTQPWRFLYALRDTPHWPRFLELLSEKNQSWACNASALVVIVSNALASPTHAFDAGAAWAMLALQATCSGWQAHGMAGFDKLRTITALNVPEGYSVEAIVAIGRVGDPSLLPERLQAREFPSHRYSLEEVAMEGGFPA